MIQNKPQMSLIHSALSERRLVIVSNRLPFNVKVENVKITFHESAGGLVTGLASFMQSRRRTPALSMEHLWVGWPGSTVEVSLQGQLIREAQVMQNTVIVVSIFVNPLQFGAGEDLDKYPRDLERDTVRLETRYVRKDGSIIWANVSASIMRDARGEPQLEIVRLGVQLVRHAVADFHGIFAAAMVGDGQRHAVVPIGHAEEVAARVQDAPLRHRVEAAAAGVERVRGDRVVVEVARRCHVRDVSCPTGQLAWVVDGAVLSAPRIQPDPGGFTPFDRKRIGPGWLHRRTGPVGPRRSTSAPPSTT